MPPEVFSSRCLAITEEEFTRCTLNQRGSALLLSDGARAWFFSAADGAVSPLLASEPHGCIEILDETALVAVSGSPGQSSSPRHVKASDRPVQENSVQRAASRDIGCPHDICRYKAGAQHGPESPGFDQRHRILSCGPVDRPLADKVRHPPSPHLQGRKTASGIALGRMVVLTQRMAHVHELGSLQPLRQIETANNPGAVVAVSPTETRPYMVGATGHHTPDSDCLSTPVPPLLCSVSPCLVGKRRWRHGGLARAPGCTGAMAGAPLPPAGAARVREGRPGAAI